jgi:glycosyltransferase involved in cell wall biosynthesis
VRVRIHVEGPRHHGVVRHAGHLAGLLRARGIAVVDDGAADVTHAQFTDGLWGHDIAEAATAFERWSTSIAGPLVVTLHDLPGADPDRARDARRRAGYARVTACCDTVVVSSDHEAARAVPLGATAARVIELPLPASLPVPAGTVAVRSPATLGVVGFVYPGKGHADVIAAAARRDPPARVVCLGAASPGHDPLVGELRARAEALGVELVVSGPQSDTGLARRMAGVTVPVVPARLVSASASLLTWLAQGRRPLVADTDYSREIVRRHPGAVRLYHDDAELDALVDAGIRRPARARRRRPPRWADVGGLHAALYEQVLDHSRAQ